MGSSREATATAWIVLPSSSVDQESVRLTRPRAVGGRREAKVEDVAVKRTRTGMILRTIFGLSEVDWDDMDLIVGEEMFAGE